MILYDFRCGKCGNVFESYVKSSDNKHTACRECGHDAHRMISPVRSKLEGHSGSFPGAAMKWEREHEKAGRTPVQE